MPEQCFILSEMVWARVKGRVAEKNVKKMTMQQLKEIVQEAFSEVV